MRQQQLLEPVTKCLLSHLRLGVPPTAAAEVDTARKLNRAVVLRETRARLLRAVKQTYGELSAVPMQLALSSYKAAIQKICHAQLLHPSARATACL